LGDRELLGLVLELLDLLSFNSSSSDFLEAEDSSSADFLAAEESFDEGLWDLWLLGLELELPVLELVDLLFLNSSSSDFLGDFLEAEESFDEGLWDRELLGLELELLVVLKLLDLLSFDEGLRGGRLLELELMLLLGLVDLLFFISDMVE
jgi:hypothetical protein